MNDGHYSRTHDCRHESDRLGYLAWHRDADERHKRGEHQRLCPHCRRYVWESMYHDSKEVGL